MTMDMKANDQWFSKRNDRVILMIDGSNNTEFNSNKNVSKMNKTQKTTFYTKTGIFAKYHLQENGRTGLCYIHKSEIHNKLFNILPNIYKKTN